MAEWYLISIDQSTQGTKALLFDERGIPVRRCDMPHRQIVSPEGWVSHDPEEIYRNTIRCVHKVVEEAGIDRALVAGVGISNQRETSLIWDRESHRPLADAVVWQCARAAGICQRPGLRDAADMIRTRTGIPVSPYFPAAKFAWLLENIPEAEILRRSGQLCFGTIDTWLIFRLTKGAVYKTDFSNASRTQLFDINTLSWDRELCDLFGVDHQALPQICDSDSEFGRSDFEGFFPTAIPIHGVLGDSNGALFGQGCLRHGDCKATYGTGSSIMMNLGERPVNSRHGLAVSVAWRMNGRAQYVLEGNINYTGAVISWLKNDLKMISSAGETEELAEKAAQDDHLYLVPAFTGLGAPYWNSQVNAALTGITRTTGRAEIVRAALECIAYQIADVIHAMEKDAGSPVRALQADGGPTRNSYLMQFQSDILDAGVLVPEAEELSGIGAAYAAGIAMGLYSDKIFEQLNRQQYSPAMSPEDRSRKYRGWKAAVRQLLAGVLPESVT